jgi:hypothetical protein
MKASVERVGVDHLRHSETLPAGAQPIASTRDAQQRVALADLIHGSGSRNVADCSLARITRASADIPNRGGAPRTSRVARCIDANGPAKGAAGPAPSFKIPATAALPTTR